MINDVKRGSTIDMNSAPNPYLSPYKKLCTPTTVVNNNSLKPVSISLKPVCEFLYSQNC